MASAPKDGTAILIGWYLPGEPRTSPSAWTEARAWWDKDEKAWTDYSVKNWGYEEVQHYTPEFWMPVPAGPNASSPVPSKQSELLEAAIQALWHLGSDADRITLADNHKWKTSQDEAAALLRTAIRNYEQGGGG